MEHNFIFRRGCTKNLKEFVGSAKNILFITGNNSFYECGGEEIINSLRKFGYQVLRYSNFKVNPNYEDLCYGAKIVSRFNPDLIIGIGGGSVLDTAKLLSVLQNNKIEILKILLGEKPILLRKIKLILIPTTAGSGSEATHFAVAYFENIKFSIASYYLLPDIVLLDGRLTDSLNKRLTAITALDAFSQAIESIWANKGNDESIKYAEESLKIIIEIFDNLITNPDKLLRDKMLFASYLAGKAINISKTTLPHAVSYSLTVLYGIPHGLAVALTLGQIIIYNSNAEKKKYYNEESFNSIHEKYNLIFSLLNVKDGNMAKHKIDNMLALAGLPNRLKMLGINSKRELLNISNNVNLERLKNNPVKISKYQLNKIMEEIY